MALIKDIFVAKNILQTWRFMLYIPNMPQPKDTLAHLNLSPQEIEVYLSFLTVGRAGIAQIAKKLGKNRAGIYFHVKNLLEKRMIKETRSGKALQYVAVPPKDLGERLEQWTGDFKSIIPWLESLRKVDAETPIIEVYDSKQGYFRIYEEISYGPVGSMFRVLEGKEALDAEFSLLPQEQWNIFFSRVKERKIETKAIFTLESADVPVKKLTKKNQLAMSGRVWHLRLVPEAVLPFQQLLFVYGDKIAFMFPRTSLVVTIKHRAIADALAVIFDGLYQLGKPATRGWKEYMAG
ncbi:MAG: helix-turn-helix domain-containing protein [Patescibacteria group bacterium]